MHFRSVEFEGAILAKGELTSFSVRRGHRYGEELAAIHFSAKFKRPRHLEIAFFKATGDLPLSIANRPAKRSPLGDWLLDFGPRVAIPSRRNAILVDGNDCEIVAVRAVENNTLEIDAHAGLEELVVFAIGFSSFACNMP
jgi:hypothetical protein